MQHAAPVMLLRKGSRTYVFAALQPLLIENMQTGARAHRAHTRAHV